MPRGRRSGIPASRVSSLVLYPLLLPCASHVLTQHSQPPDSLPAGVILVASRLRAQGPAPSRMARGHSARAAPAPKMGPWTQQALHVSKDLSMVTALVDQDHPGPAPAQAPPGSADPGTARATASPFAKSGLQSGAGLVSVLLELHPEGLRGPRGRHGAGTADATL